MTAVRRIGLLTPGWPGHNTPNGIATSVWNLAQGLRRAGVLPVILTHRPDGPGPADIPVVPLPQLKWRLWDRLLAKAGNTDVVHRHLARNVAAAVQHAIAAHQLDAVIMEETNGWAGTVQALVPVPVFITLHGPWVLLKAQESMGQKADAEREAREARAFRSVAGLIAPSRNVLAAVTAALPDLKTPRIVLPNTLEADAEIPRAADLPARDILFVGRVARIKGADTVLEAFTQLVAAHPQARLTFVGQDYGLKRADGSTVFMQTLLQALPEEVRARLSYKGALDRAAVAQHRAGHAIALIASRYENLNYTLLEAMAAGQAVVSTAVGGPAEVLENEKTALLVPPDDPAAMAAALGRLVADPALTQRLGRAGHDLLLTGFSPDRVAARTLQFMEETLAAR